MKTASSAEKTAEALSSSSSRRETAGAAGQASDLTIAATKPGSNKWVWICALAGILAIVIAYYFAFSAAHSAQIKDVPLATGGAKP